eukprot:CAMPEP_0198458388 /NCGR_PEP_ID=MMETSP1453-20131121/35192_1 /TAXON_ID=1461543 ORGANISM="Unidentified sp., Strain RCC701" /NCGR_SAMPLE_ID=MMETSP1453 /ASSEMBLY_ACC=CAM_ASM_001118 /LENGTH=41 /DNA_ID= /DNA_START= /DNA_END= /DNA_ORIENTATION=
MPLVAIDGSEVLNKGAVPVEDRVQLSLKNLRWRQLGHLKSC